ncbi:hypothetical protein [Anatilimnocola floriformis]|uniref:hypothetical protein n=1 Tax=Anatilimnocola floriformis TaxID=2948575 RepID=UPI0020C2B3E4|nr:hypothetical protein [Anatilimnocola floriformis]
MSFDPNSPNPYAASSTQPTTPKKSNTLLYVLLGVGGVLLLSCAGCIGLGVYGFGQIGNVLTPKIQPQLQADPVVQEHIGNMTQCEWTITGLVQEVEKNKARHAGRDSAFKVKGDKGEGLVVGKLEPNGENPRLINAELVLPNGEFHKLSQ